MTRTVSVLAYGSTVYTRSLPGEELKGHTDLHDLLGALEADSSLLDATRLRERLTALDDLDRCFGHLDDEHSSGPASRLHQRAKSLRRRFEAANSDLYRSLRLQFREGQPRALLPWLECCASAGERTLPLPGLGFDHLDELLSGVLDLSEPSGPALRPTPEMIRYQPTPVRHILDLIAAAAVTEDDFLVDLGSGLGHVPLLVSMITGAQSLGIEIQPAYVASARRCAEGLQLSGVHFVAQDVRDADLSRGTVFYLYSPFSGSILEDVLNALEKESTRRPVTICSFGPCTHTVSAETWLTANAAPDTGRITVFRSR